MNHSVFVCDICFSREVCVCSHQDEAGVVPVPPAERRHADFWVLVVMENLTSTVGVSAEDEAWFKPLQQLRRETTIQLRGRLLLPYIISFITVAICCFCISDSSRLCRFLIGRNRWMLLRRDCGALTLWEASLDNTSYFSLNSRCRSSGSAASCPVQLASLTLYSG